jgi:transposase
MNDMIIGVDLAKNVFQIHGARRTGEVMFRKQLTHAQFPKFMARQQLCLVVFEACGSSHHWANEMEAPGHDVKLIAPQYVRPFVKHQKNDAAESRMDLSCTRETSGSKGVWIALTQQQFRSIFVQPKKGARSRDTATRHNLVLRVAV